MLRRMDQGSRTWHLATCRPLQLVATQHVRRKPLECGRGAVPPKGRRPQAPGRVALGGCLAALVLYACGGGGGGGGFGGGTTGGGATNTPVAIGTPSPTGGPGPGGSVIVVSGDIVAAAKQAPAGSTLAVVAGSYPAIVLQPGDLAGQITLLADTTGALSGGVPGAVVVVAGSASAAVSVAGQDQLTLDGFTVRGGSSAGILIEDSSAVTVRNCIVTDSTFDGVRFERSADGLVFDNLVFNNAGAGISAFGSPNLRVINNTVFQNQESGIFLGFDETSSTASNGGTVENNIVNMNLPAGMGIVVDTGSPSSLDGFQGDYNLNTDGYSGPDPGAHDLNTDPLFVPPGGQDFFLNVPLAGSGESPAIDAGDPDTDPDLVAALAQRTTQLDSTLDMNAVDLGYHHPVAAVAPTATPRPRTTRSPTRTPTRAVTGLPGATPTRTPTPGGPTRTRTQTATPTPTHRGPLHSPTRTPG
jgi:parallel beta-helix repeat protein